MPTERQQEIGAGEQLHPQRPEHNVIILFQRQQSILHYIAQGFMNAEIDKQLSLPKGRTKIELDTINTQFGAHTRIHATQIGLSLGIIDKHSLLNDSNIDTLLPHEQALLEAMIADNGGNSRYEDLAKAIGKAPYTVRNYLQDIKSKLDTRDSTHSATVYKAHTMGEPEIPQDTLIYIEGDPEKARSEHCLTKENIQLLALLRDQVSPAILTDINPPANQQLANIRRVIDTPARLMALINGLPKRIIELPPPTEEAEITTDFLQQHKDFIGLFIF